MAIIFLGQKENGDKGTLGLSGDDQNREINTSQL
jgi:hypothetical protein